MLKTYLFIPANRPDFIDKINTVGSDCFIIDFEEPVSFDERRELLGKQLNINSRPDIYVRIPLVYEQSKDSVFLDYVIQSGFRKIVLPKVESIHQLEVLGESIERYESNLEFVLLVENPKLLLKLEEVLESDLINITAIALGSHDYCNAMGMEHALENLYFARNQVLHYAKAYNIEAIDIVSMDFHADLGFKDECRSAFSMGFEAKFILHPNQLKALQSIRFYSDDEINKVKKLYRSIENINLDEFSVVTIDGVLYEKPHLKRVMNIINWVRKYGNK